MPDFSKELDIESLISAPLVAVSKANAVMAQGQTRFLLEYCFNKKGDNHEPVMIRMALTRAVIYPAQQAEPGIPPTLASAPGVTPVVLANEGMPATPARPKSIQNEITYFELPLLTIVPLNSLAVDKISIDFDLEITSTTAKPTTTNNDTNNKITDQKPQLYGRISNTTGNDTNNADKSNVTNNTTTKLKVNINAATLPLPKGVLAIIDMYTKAIQPSPAESK
ncbi:uncharacterized protein DUF2589 [Mucilaginibacter gracilis]|uniref:Uncharacterized protein DUF2589 n=2 Tax=Mucilaginibacter gracilis TaxID=423350 RepID=A0A495J4S5_9SPHI|nr:uncharacterized protein DUF2589 [Mucilaginibacter gracilis]